MRSKKYNVERKKAHLMDELCEVCKQAVKYVGSEKNRESEEQALCQVERAFLDVKAGKSPQFLYKDERGGVE